MSGLFSLDSWSTVWTHRESFLLGLGNTLQTAVSYTHLTLPTT